MPFHFQSGGARSWPAPARSSEKTEAKNKELEARIKNLDTDMQTLEEKHKTQRLQPLLLFLVS